MKTGPVLPAKSLIANRFKVTHNANIDRLLPSIGPQIVQGWLHRKPQRFNKTLTFAKLRDSTGKIIQLVDKNTPSLFRSLKPDSTVSVQILRNGADWECQSLEVLGSANLVPGELQAEKTKEWPPKYRYIQLRQPEFQNILRTRAKIVSKCRSVLDSHGFTEIETPILFKSTPEGAREFLVPTRRRGEMYALPQSPQQYKQLLIASGFDKYYQVARCFRDEDLRADRQPEFTQLDLEMGFSKMEDVQSVVGDIVKQAWALVGRELNTVNPESLEVVKQPTEFQRLTYSECISKYGIDKPDLRCAARILELEGVMATRNQLFPVLECIKLPQSLDFMAKDTNQRVVCLKYENNDQLRSFVSELGRFDQDRWPDISENIVSTFSLRVGDVLAFGDRQKLSYENPTPLGQVRQLISASDSALVRSDSGDNGGSIAVWVENFPSFEPLEAGCDENGYPIYDQEKLKATHHPFTMISLDDYHYLESNDPLKCHGMHFDLVIDGVEVGGGSQRIHDADLQRYVLENILEVKHPDKIFGHLLEALGTGCPPHAGLAIGLDRMIAMLLRRSSIRDVIAFPKTMTGSDPIVGSPSKVTPRQLNEYHLRIGNN